MQAKLIDGGYPTAREFRGDFNDMLESCLGYRPEPHPWEALAEEFRQLFDVLWHLKDTWEAEMQRNSVRKYYYVAGLTVGSGFLRVQAANTMNTGE